MSKLTWSDQQLLAQQNSGLSDPANLLAFKRDMNTGATLFVSQLGREYNRHSRFTDLKSGYQFYQMPEDAHRLKEIIVSSGTYTPPMEQIPDETGWRMMNMLPITGVPTHYWIKGYKEVGLYPTPSANISQGIELVFSPEHLTMTEDDYTTGTINVQQNSVTISIANGVFTPKMADLGLWLTVTDGSDENWYKITGYTSSSTLTIENFYQGETGSTKPFRIAQIMDNMPAEFLEAPVDYAMYRFYMKRGVIGLGQATAFKQSFDNALQAAKDEYGQVTESQVVNADDYHNYRLYNPFRGDPPAGITA